MRVLSSHTRYVCGGVFTPDDKRALSASADETTRPWDVETGAKRTRCRTTALTCRAACKTVMSPETVMAARSSTTLGSPAHAFSGGLETSGQFRFLGNTHAQVLQQPIAKAIDAAMHR